MLDKKYNHLEVEKQKYENWKEKGYFNSGDTSKKPFCITIPPPNVTGRLHLGHAWDTTLQDILIRYKRMDGYDALWLPGMDHSAISTEAKVVAKIKSEGKDKHEVGRAAFLEECWDWSNKHKEIIREQWGKLGLSVDYTKERFTLDEKLNKAVTHVFVQMYKKGLIYKGERIINWDPDAMTALSNEEVIHKDVEGAFYHIKYLIEGSSDYLEIATTRPETLFGDTAVAVNPKDDRYKNLIGKNVVLPIINKLIPIVADDHADPEFGTGVVKITPAHDANDFEVGNRHGLERVVAINTDGKMNEQAGPYNGMDRFACRKQLIKDLKQTDLLIKIEKMVHSVGHSERTDAIVEPYLSKQWFVKMKPLAERTLENQKDKDTKVSFTPSRYEKTMNHWMEIAYDWCISRQQWWGHRIPAWYKGEEIYVGTEAPVGEGWVQDPDVLDTWFSSALWPFSTMGWPENTEDYQRYYPNNVMVMGYDIIFFWGCRMVFQGLEFTNTRPYKDCIIHGIVRADDGRKMSKSLGNGVDPMDVIEKYGADALRYYLTTSTAAGMDLSYEEEKVKSTWNFINKIWNASRFCLMKLEDKEIDYKLTHLSEIDEWILTKLNKTIKQVRLNLDRYEFNNVGSELYRFIWDDFCDNYIELTKDKPNLNVLFYTLDKIIKMLHPFMPYVTEEIYQSLPSADETIMLAEFPIYDEKHVFTNTEKYIDDLIQDLTNVRNFKVINNIKKGALAVIEAKDEYKAKLAKLLNTEPIQELKDGVTFVGKTFSVNFETEQVNNDELIKDLLKQKEVLAANIKRRTSLLANDGYVKNAPEYLITGEREKLKEEEQSLTDIDQRINELK